MTVNLGEAEPGRLHRRLELGLRAQTSRVGSEVCVGRVRSDGKVTVAGVQVDGLRASDDYRVDMAAQRGQRVEQHSAGRHVAGIEVTHPPCAAGLSCASDERRQRGSLAAIHSSSASPSAGMRPLPARQSTAT